MKKTIIDYKQRYINWKEKCENQIPEISSINSKILIRYLTDMELGLNIGRSSKKGGRSYNRLYNLQQRMVFITKKLEELYGVKDLTQLNENHLHELFTGMKNGTIKRLDGKTYQDPANFVKIMKAFWHWHQKVNRKKGIEIYDITQDLDTSVEKPKWVYLSEEQIKDLYVKARYDYKVLIMFLFDTGIRSPSELINVKVSDFHNDYRELMIRDEISKTFGRRIKLMLCADLIRNYVGRKKLKKNDYLFKIKQDTTNKYLQKLATKVFGEKKSPAGQKYSELTMYDFRHCSCCYWLPRYKSESALKYRFGWKQSDKIHYYSELLGMRDTITDEDRLVDISKLELEKKLAQSKAKNDLLSARISKMEEQMEVVSRIIG